MDKLIYVAMTGAKQTMRAQSINNHNLANAGTLGFRASLMAQTDREVEGMGYPTRVNAVMEDGAWDFGAGPLRNTGRDLDVAVQGEGWIAVQKDDGTEGYTRAGNLRINNAGLLETSTGHLVLGNGGPLAIPPHQRLFIGDDGQISIVPEGQKPNTLVEVDRIKLVNPPAVELTQDPDGLFRRIDGGESDADAGLTVVSGSLEGSNVSTSAALVHMIELSRQFEMQVQMMKKAEESDEAAQRLMRMS